MLDEPSCLTDRSALHVEKVGGVHVCSREPLQPTVTYNKMFICISTDSKFQLYRSVVQHINPVFLSFLQSLQISVSIWLCAQRTLSLPLTNSVSQPQEEQVNPQSRCLSFIKSGCRLFNFQCLVLPVVSCFTKTFQTYVTPQQDEVVVRSRSTIIDFRYRSSDHDYLAFQERVSYVLHVSQRQTLHLRQGMTVEQTLLPPGNIMLPPNDRHATLRWMTAETPRPPRHRETCIFCLCCWPVVEWEGQSTGIWAFCLVQGSISR